MTFSEFRKHYSYWYTWRIILILVKVEAQGDREKVIAVIELKNECGLTQMDGWEDTEIWLGARYILEAETNKFGDPFTMRDEKKAGVKNDS